MKKKRRKSKAKKSGVPKIVIFLVLAGVGAGLFFLLRHEISGLVKPRAKKPALVEKKTVTLYFSDFDEEFLTGEKIEIPKGKGVEDEARGLLEALIHGPRGQLLPTVPPSAKLLSVHLDKSGTAKVDFDRALSRDHPGGSTAEMMTVYSIVNSLTRNFPEIKRVQFLIEGKGIETIKGHLSLRGPVSPKPDLIKKGK